MSSATAATAEHWPDPSTTRSCGAVCLSTVYGSLGVKASQAEIWRAIARPNRFGSLASTTHLMGKDALDRGLMALILQARDPMYVLRACQNGMIQAIVNHRLAADSPVGHYSVVAEIDAQNIVLNDPLFRTTRRLSHREFVDLWQARFDKCEISGFVLIAISDKPITAPECELCHTPFAESMPCPRCGQTIGLQLTPVLGCLKPDCAARLWTAICCPQCDYMWHAQPSAAPAIAGAPAAVPAPPPFSFSVQPVPLPPAPAADSWNLSAAFNAIDAFKAKLLRDPVVATNKDVQQQMRIIEDQKQKLTQLQAEYITEAKAQNERIASLRAASQARMQAYLQQLAELNKPAETLNADELGHALLKNLGLSR